jgi:hypothetical protein
MMKHVTGFRTGKYNVPKLASYEVEEQYRQQIEEICYITFTEHDNGENCGRDVTTTINSVAEGVVGIMGPVHKGTWFDGECQAATGDKHKAYRKVQQGYDTRNVTEEYKEKRRKERAIHIGKKKEWINVELENMELPRKQDKCSKF